MWLWQLGRIADAGRTEHGGEGRKQGRKVEGGGRSGGCEVPAWGERGGEIAEERRVEGGGRVLPQSL